MCSVCYNKSSENGGDGWPNASWAPFSFMMLLSHNVFLSIHLSPVIKTFLTLMCLTSFQTLYWSISSNLRKCLFWAVPQNATYRRPLLILQGRLLWKAPPKYSAGRCVLNVLHLHKHTEPEELPAALPGTLNHMSKRQENNIPGNSYREKQR